MSVSRLHFAKSETRDLAEHARLHPDVRLQDSAEWTMNNSTFFTVFVAIAAVLALLALIAH